jgi:predicted Holliday junction resolvase-like endonuclease
MSGVEIAFYILIFITFLLTLWLVWYKRRLDLRYRSNHAALQAELTKAMEAEQERIRRARKNYEAARDEYRMMIRELQSPELPKAN